jgi:hypothetical protein
MLEVDFVIVVQFCDDGSGRDRIYWDRVTVLREVGVAEGLTAGRARA